MKESSTNVTMAGCHWVMARLVGMNAVPMHITLASVGSIHNPALYDSKDALNPFKKASITL